MSVDVLHARVAFRQRALVDVLDLSLRFVVIHAAAYARVALVVLVPSLSVSLVVARLGGWLAGSAVALATALFAQVPFTVLASRLVFEDPVRVRDVLRGALRDLPRIFAARVVWLFLFLAALSCLVVPAAWVVSAFLFVDEVLLLERASMGDAFSRAQRVASSSLGATFTVACALGLVLAGAVGLAETAGRAILGDLLQFRPPPSAWTEGGSVLCFVGWFAVLPYATTARLFAYLDVRTRAEGWDIQTKFAELASRSANEERA